VVDVFSEFLVASTGRVPETIKPAGPRGPPQVVA